MYNVFGEKQSYTETRQKTDKKIPKNFHCYSIINFQLFQGGLIMSDKKIPKNFQVVPVKNFKITIDYLSREALNAILNPNESKEGVVIESRYKGITSKYTIINVSSNGVKLTEFDRAILNAAISEQTAGNEYTTPEIIYHLIGGGHVLTNKMRQKILDSFERLATVRIVVEMHPDSKKKLGYDLKDKTTTYRGYLMPTESVDIRINGQHSSSIHFLKQGIIFFIADMKDQMLTCSPDLLNSPIKHSERGIALNHYLLRRTLEIKGSHESRKHNSRIKLLRSVITFDDLLKNCGLENCSRTQKQNIKNAVEVILNFFVEQNIIKSFKFETHGQKIHSIVIDFSTDSCE